jgi:hypothetical protein
MGSLLIEVLVLPAQKTLTLPSSLNSSSADTVKDSLVQEDMPTASAAMNHAKKNFFIVLIFFWMFDRELV